MLNMNTVNCITLKPETKESTHKENIFSRNISSIFEVTIPIYYLSKLFGYAAFHLPKADANGCYRYEKCLKNRVYVTSVDLFIWTVCLVCYIALLYWNIVRNFHAGISSSSSLILDIGGKIILMLGLMMAILSTILNFIHRCKVIKILYELHEFDLCIGDAGLSVNHKRHFKWTLIVAYMTLLASFVGMFLTYFFIGELFKTIPLLCVSYMAQNASFTMLMNHMMLFLFAVKTRFQLLNEGFWYLYMERKQIFAFSFSNFLIFILISSFSNFLTFFGSNYFIFSFSQLLISLFFIIF